MGPEMDAWKLVVDKLPIKEDEEEAPVVHEIIAQNVIQQNAAMLGPNQARLPQILGALSEIYKNEDLSKTETDTMIFQIFTRIPQDKLLTMASSFSEKQQKKIEHMLTSNAVA